MHIDTLEAVQLTAPSVVTIGVFDGVHRGHQALIRRITDAAHAAGRQAVVLTFFPHPDVVLRGLHGRYYLTTPAQRADLLRALAVDVVVTHPFDDSVRQMRAAVFVDRLLHHVRMAALHVGADFALGYQREGDIAFLTAQGATRGFTVTPFDLVTQDAGGRIITSTGIREALLAGDMAHVRDWLGRSYTVSGAVVHGEKRGRTIGFPTANVAVWSEQVLPAAGVYACRASIGAETFMAVTNIGVRPTFNGQSVTVEAHVLDFDRDIYGHTMTLTFEKRLRPEQKFTGIEALIAQIRADTEAGRAYLSSSS